MNINRPDNNGIIEIIWNIMLKPNKSIAIPIIGTVKAPHIHPKPWPKDEANPLLSGKVLCSITTIIGLDVRSNIPANITNIHNISLLKIVIK